MMDNKASEASSKPQTNLGSSPAKESTERFLGEESKPTRESKAATDDFTDSLVVDFPEMMEPDNNKQASNDPWAPEGGVVVRPQQDFDEGFDDEEVDIQNISEARDDLESTGLKSSSHNKDLEPPGSRTSDDRDRNVPDKESVDQVGDVTRKLGIPDIITLPVSEKNASNDSEKEKCQASNDKGSPESETNTNEPNVVANVGNGDEKPHSGENKDENPINIENKNEKLPNIVNGEDNLLIGEKIEKNELNAENKAKTINAESKDEKPLFDCIEGKKLNVENKEEHLLNVESKVINIPNVEFIKAENVLNEENAKTDKEEVKSNKEDENLKSVKEEVKDTTKDEEILKPLDNVEDSKSPSDSAGKGVGEWMDILGSGHLLKRVIKPGVPDTRPNKSDICILDYTGWLNDGTEVDKAENLEIQLNDNEVIQGIDFALALMDKGEEAEVRVSPRFAYGVLGKEPNIPGGSTLTYNIKLLDVRDEPVIHSLSLKDRVMYGLRKKQRGNFWYAREDYSLAIDCYRRALEYLDDTAASEPQDVASMQKLFEERLKTYNNLAASQLRVSAFDAALMSVNNVLNAQPRNVKALYRKARILRAKGDINPAMQTVRMALSYEPESKILQQELSSLLAEDGKIFGREKELYKEMLGNTPNQGKDEKKSSSNHYNTLKWFTIISFAVAVIGTIAFKYSK